jgi:hypothetical protein
MPNRIRHPVGPPPTGCRKCDAPIARLLLSSGSHG